MDSMESAHNEEDRGKGASVIKKAVEQRRKENTEDSCIMALSINQTSSHKQAMLEIRLQ